MVKVFDVEMEYVVDPLSFNDFAFEHSVPPVNMHAVHMKHVTPSLPLLQQAPSAGGRITTCQNAAGGLCRTVIWALQRLAFMAGDDELLRVSCLCLHRFTSYVKLRVGCQG